MLLELITAMVIFGIMITMATPNMIGGAKKARLKLIRNDIQVMEQQLDVAELAALLDRCQARDLDLQQPASLTPLSFPLWAESVRGTLSSEDWRSRVERAAGRLERKHG